MSFCTKCGTKALDAEIYCLTCGEKIRRTENETVTQQAENQTEQISTYQKNNEQNDKKKFAIMCIIFNAVGVPCFLYRHFV